MKNFLLRTLSKDDQRNRAEVVSLLTLFIFIFCFMVWVASCTTHKNVVTTSEEKDSVVTSLVVTQTTEREKLDTIIVIPANEINGEMPINKLMAGDPLTIKNDSQEVTVIYNPVTKKINVTGKIKEQKVNVSFDKYTISTKREHSKTAVHTKEKEKTKEKETTGFPLKGAAIAISVFLFLLLLFYVMGRVLWKRYFK